MVDYTVSATRVTTEFEFDGDNFNVEQILINIFGNEFYLDPDQAVNLLNELEYAHDHLGEN